MTDRLHLDWETAADADLTKVGLDVYTSPRSHPRVLMGAYGINPSSERDLHHWEPHRRKIPAELKEALEDPEVEKWAFGGQFERVVANRILGIKSPIEGWRCSMALAYMQSFSGGLEDVGEQIGLPQDKQKLKTGKKLIHMFSMPQRITKNQPHLWRNWLTDPEEWQEFGRYNVQDVVTEMAVHTRLVAYPIPDVEWAFYQLDQIINDRGMPVDIDFIDNVIWMAARRKAELLAEMKALTGLDNPNSGQQLLPWLQERGYPYDDLRKESVTKALKGLHRWHGEPSKRAIKILKLRQWAARTSTSKAVTARLVVGDDNRARYLYQFSGAGRTGRASGRLIQSQNMMRTPKLFDAEYSDDKLSFVTDIIRRGDYDAFDLFIEEPMLALTGCMRGLFRAADGDQLIAGDVIAAESVGLAYLSRCERLLDVFRNGRDPYKDFGVQFYKKPYDEITREERRFCKPAELGCGYRLSAGKDIDGVQTGLLAYAEGMGVNLTLEEAQRCVAVYREHRPEVVKFWYDCEKAIRFVLRTHKPFKLGLLTFKWLKPYLLIELPSGRHLYYYKPRLEERVIRTGRMKWVRIEGRLTEVEDTYVKTVFTYMGRNHKNNQWTRLDGHGGIIVQNCLSGATEVSTNRGWVRLVDVQPNDLLWDGVDFVSHGGVVCMGSRQTIEIQGVKITPDHKVLTERGFVEANNLKNAPPRSGFDGTDFWSAHCNRVYGRRWSKILVEIAVRMRAAEVGCRIRASEGSRLILRMFAERAGRKTVANARHESNADSYSLVIDAGSLQYAYPQGVSQLRGSRHFGLRRLASFREFLSRHGAVIFERVNFGSARQQRKLHPGKLLVDYVSKSGAEYSIQSSYRYSERSDAAVRSGRIERYRFNDFMLSISSRLARSSNVRRSELREQDLVYDILNVGPRHRFTVRSRTGAEPFVVANCVEGFITRDLLRVNLMRLHEAGFFLIGHAHDEAIAEERVGDNYYTLERACEIIRQPIEWAPGLPIGANGWQGAYYRK